jgi:hypothetical protein
MGGGSNPYNLGQFGLNGVAYVLGGDGSNTNNVNSGKTIYDRDTPATELSTFPIAKFFNQTGNFTNGPGALNLGVRTFFGVADSMDLWAYSPAPSYPLSSTSVTGYFNEFSYVPNGDIPEPLSFVLLGSGLLAFGLLRRKSA